MTTTPTDEVTGLSSPVPKSVLTSAAPTSVPTPCDDVARPVPVVDRAPVAVPVLAVGVRPTAEPLPGIDDALATVERARPGIGAGTSTDDRSTGLVVDPAEALDRLRALVVTRVPMPGGGCSPVAGLSVAAGPAQEATGSAERDGLVESDGLVAVKTPTAVADSAVDHGLLDHGLLDHGLLDHGLLDHGAGIAALEDVRRLESWLTWVKHRVVAATAHAAAADQRAWVDAHPNRFDDDPLGPSRGLSRLQRSALGDRCAVAEIACALRVSENAAHELVTRAERLDSWVPQTSGALRDGRITGEAAVLIADAVGEYLNALAATTTEAEAEAYRGAVRATEDVLLPQAERGRTPVQLGARARRARERFHPAPFEQRRRAAHAERFVRISDDRDGMARLHALLPAAVAFRIDGRLTAIARQLADEHHSDGDGCSLPDQRPPGGRDSDRSLVARPTNPSPTLDNLRADVLADLLGGLTGAGLLERAGPHDGVVAPSRAGRQAARTDRVAGADVCRRHDGGELEGPPPRVLLTVPAETLLGGDDPGLLGDFGPIAAADARELARLATSFMLGVTAGDESADDGPHRCGGLVAGGLVTGGRAGPPGIGPRTGCLPGAPPGAPPGVTAGAPPGVTARGRVRTGPACVQDQRVAPSSGPDPAQSGATPEPPSAPTAPQAPDDPDVPHAPDVPHGPDVLHAPDGPNAPEALGVPDGPSGPDLRETSETLETPETPEPVEDLETDSIPTGGLFTAGMVGARLIPVVVTNGQQYRVPAALRRALAVRDGTCRFPGCRRSAVTCDLDHVDAWVDGGRSDPVNLAHLCRKHHVLKHHSGWAVTVSNEGDGALTWVSPTGRTVVTEPDDDPAPF